MKYDPIEPSNEHYKALFKFETKNPNRESLNHKQALIAISVGQLYHEGGKFLATIDLINKQGFERCDIVVGDTLQRYNYYGVMSPDHALNHCKQQGSLWLKRNAHVLSKLNMPHRIIRWDELLAHEYYEKNKKNIMNAYHNDTVYKNALHANVETYISRLKKLNPESDESLLFSWGLQYLLEECPVIMPLWAEMGYDFIIYPKPLTLGMAKTRDYFVNDTFEGKCQWLSLRFKKKSRNSNVYPLPISFGNEVYIDNVVHSGGAA